MTKVIKTEFEKLEDLNDKDVSLTCDTSLEVFNNEFNRMSGMDNDLFTYEAEVSKSHTYLLRTLRDSRLMKNIRMIESMNGTEMYHGLMRNHGLTLEFGLNPHQLSIIVNPSIIKLDVRNGQHVVGRMIDTVMEETYLELT
uniref:Uncharacterized protein n=1 Tax=Tanacetum cinerariifolium TaxID=118510 RepID=A0A6L2NU01_TANCI|nr:hypothetical protein [Tanacetum cinerariifolium]